MRLIFVATGDIALPSFHALLEHGPRPLALITQPDKPVGRHQTPTPPQIKLEAQAAAVPVMQPERIGEAIAEIRELNPEVIVVMAYGQILPQSLLELPGCSVINLHASLLPRHRGAACIQAAIDAGDTHSGITSLHVVRKLDAGDMILRQSLEIMPDETGGSLHDRLAALAPSVLEQTLSQLASGSAPRIPQDPELVTYISKLNRADGRIDWSRSAAEIERRVRAYDPWPGTFTLAAEKGSEKRIKLLPHTRLRDEVLAPGEILIHDGSLIVGCGSGALELTTLQPEGGRRMSTADFLRGNAPERFF